MRNPTEDWPAWPEFTHDKGELDPDNVRVKKKIAAEYGEGALRKSWLAVCKKLESLTKEIEEKQTAMIPELTYDDFFALDEVAREKLKDVGCFVIRGAVPSETAKSWFEGLQSYVEDNKDSITGWPASQPAIYHLYWTQAQVQARTHPRAMALHRALNELWHDDEDVEKSFAAPLAYADALRIRPPGQPFSGLGPHIDAGSLCRWAEPLYRKSYDKIWSGEADQWDPYDLTVRKRADPNFYKGPAQSQVMRAFQGWTALTTAGANEGSLLLYPDLKTSLAYVLLRPFFRPPENEEDVLDAEKWTFDIEDAWFPGVWRDAPQELSPAAFPHLRLKECLVNIPTMHPGDTVWWHCDMCHTVEVEHKGKGISSVVYVAATPTTKANLDYMQRQLKSFLDGLSPEDFEGDCRETALKGYPGSEAAILNGMEGRRAVGFVA